MLGISRTFDIFFGILIGLGISTFSIALKNRNDIKHMRDYIHDEIDTLYAKLCPEFVEPRRSKKICGCETCTDASVSNCSRCPHNYLNIVIKEDK